MKTPAVLLPLAAIGLVASPAFAADKTPPQQQEHKQQEASIPFADHGGVWDWRAEGDQTVYFQDAHKRWYKARLFSPAFDLPYVQFIGIDARPNGTLDKWGAIYVHGQRYPFTSFERVDGPPSKHGKKPK